MYKGCKANSRLVLSECNMVIIRDEYLLRKDASPDGFDGIAYAIMQNNGSKADARVLPWLDKALLCEG